MTYETLSYETSDGVATVTLNRPEKLNTLTRKMCPELIEAFQNVERDKTVRAMILTGAGNKAFCAGADVQDMLMGGASLGVVERGEVVIRAPDRVILQLWNMTKPTIAAVNGVAVGGGCALLLPCDIRIAADNARFGFAFIRRGLSAADMGVTWFLPRIVGQGWAAELALTGDIIDAPTAERIGLVNRVVPTAKLTEVAREMAVRLAAGPPVATMMTKRAFAVEANMDLVAALELEAAGQIFCQQTKDHEEGFKSFLEKRPPVFTGE